MRSSLLLSLLASAIVAASQLTPTPARAQPHPPPTLSLYSETLIPSIPVTPSFTTPSSHAWDPLISSANHLLEEINERLHIDLKKRQGGAAIVAPAVAAPSPTQMSPVTVYDMDDGVARTYTQLFVAVPDQWPAPAAGTIGLGTIQGQIGVVKTSSKRDLGPSPTPVAGQVFRIRGREVKLPR